MSVIRNARVTKDPDNFHGLPFEFDDTQTREWLRGKSIGTTLTYLADNEKQLFLGNGEYTVGDQTQRIYFLSGPGYGLFTNFENPDTETTLAPLFTGGWDVLIDIQEHVIATPYEDLLLFLIAAFRSDTGQPETTNVGFKKRQPVMVYDFVNHKVHDNGKVVGMSSKTDKYVTVKYGSMTKKLHVNFILRLS